MVKFTFKVKRSGRFATGSQAQGVVAPAIQNMADVRRRGVQKTSPRRSGRLSREWYTGPVQWRGMHGRAKLDNRTPYAHYQNTRTRNRGYIERGLSGAKGQAEKELRSGIQGRMRQLWLRR